MEGGFVVSAPAKVNLCLYILGRRSDGYHEIFSIIQAVDFADELVVSPSSRFEVSVCGERLSGKNTVEVAWDVLREHLGELRPLRVHIRKRIPPGSGLGGGSSDAAAFIKAANEILNLRLTPSEMAEIGSRVGADVPFFFSKGTAIVRGKGEIVEEIEAPLGYHILILIPPFSVSTAWAYSQIRNSLTTPEVVKKIEKAGGVWEVVGLFRNDFEPVVCGRYPEVCAAIRRLRSLGAFHAGLSGSGSAVFGLFRDVAVLRRAAEAGWGSWRVFRTKPCRLESHITRPGA